MNHSVAIMLHGRHVESGYMKVARDVVTRIGGFSEIRENTTDDLIIGNDDVFVWAEVWW